MRVLVLLPHRNYPTHNVVDEWTNIYPEATVSHAGKRITLLRPLTGEVLLQVTMSPLDLNGLRGQHFDEVDQRLIVPADYNPEEKHFLRQLEMMSTRRKEDAGHDMMPLEVAWHLGLVAGAECGWDLCRRPAVAARFDKALTLWSAVCYIHQFAPPVSPPGGPVRTPAPGTAAPNPSE